MNELRQLFPLASQSFVELNAGLQNSFSKPNASDALDGKAKGKRASHDRVTVCVTSYRARLLDLDNVHGGQKFLLDCIKECKLIRDDDPESIELIVKQRKVAHRYQEKTLLELSV